MMTNDEKLELLEAYEEVAWQRLNKDSLMEQPFHLDVIERCQRIRKAIPQYRERLANEDPSPHRAGVDSE